jgi:hypothetical protein
MVRTQKSIFSLLLIGAVIFGSGCSKDDNTTAPSKAGTFYGDKKNIGNGTAKTFITLDASGYPVSIGITFTESALSNLPADSLGAEYVLTLPSQASATGFDHATINWNPYGHEPAGVYTVPHFDFHFYTISQQDQQMIMGGPDTVPVPSQYVPAGYTPGPVAIAVPMMGVHYVDPTSPEFQGQPFTKTFIFGYYLGKLAFIEPMITKAYFETHPSVSVDIKQPAAYQTTGKYYPAKYSITYNATSSEFSVALDAMTKK